MNKEYPFSISQISEKIQDELNNLPISKQWNFDNKFLRQLVGQYTYPALNRTDYIVRGAFVSRLIKDLIVDDAITRLFFSDIEVGLKYQPKWFYTSDQTENDKIHIGRRGLPHIRQGIEIPPAIVFIREIAETVPFIIG